MQRITLLAAREKVHVIVRIKKTLNFECIFTQLTLEFSSSFPYTKNKNY